MILDSYEVPVDTDGEFSFGRARVVFSGPYLNVPGFGYDVFPDGSGFMVLQGVRQDSLVAELKAIVHFDQMLIEKASVDNLGILISVFRQLALSCRNDLSHYSWQLGKVESQRVV